MNILRRIKLNRRGFSLAELMVAGATGVIIAGAASFAFIESSATFKRLNNQYDTESEMLRMMYVLKATFQQTSSIIYKGALACNAETQRGQPHYRASRGVLCSGNFNNANDGAVNMIAMGLREMGGYGTPAQSEFQAYGIYYKNPSGNRSGALYVDLERFTDSWAVVSPMNAPFEFTRLTEFEVNSVQAMDDNRDIVTTAGAGENVAMSAEIRAVMRTFVGGQTAAWRWCPAAMIAGNPACQNSPRYMDMEKRMKVNFSNNILTLPTGDSSQYSLPRRALGNLYYFRGIVPVMKQ